MKKEIIGLLVCTLLIATTALPVIGNINVHTDSKNVNIQMNGQNEKLEMNDDFSIYLKSRQFLPPEGIPQETLDALHALNFESVHAILQTFTIPDENNKQKLEEFGVKILDYIPNRAFFVSLPIDNAESIADLSFVRAITHIIPEDKIEERILEEGVNNFSMNPDGTIRITVLFYEDVNLTDGGSVVTMHHGTINASIHDFNTLIINLPEENLLDLLGEDMIQWVEDLSEPILLNDKARSITGVNVIQNSPYNLDGRGIIIGIWDNGHVGNHLDFANRVIQGDTPCQYTDNGWHATLCGGTAGGDGYCSDKFGNTGTPGQWKGMAPKAELITYDSYGLPIAAYPWIEYDSAINVHNIDLSTNSFCYCRPNGNYNQLCHDVDELVIGKYGKCIPIIVAAGNKNWGFDLPGGYDSIVTFATAKNTITVGATTGTSGDYIAKYSSQGPTDDGRVKPDLVAPSGLISTAWPPPYYPPNSYTGPNHGTSMAAPVVAGIVALFLQQWKQLFTSNPVPLPSTIKAILIQTAKDLLPTGPDFRSGYGRVDAKNAVDLILADGGTYCLIKEDELCQGDIHEYQFKVPTGANNIKVTLAWDDYPGAPNNIISLENDLDLILIDPTGNQYLPYVHLNPNTNPSAAATTGIDNRNNVEQVEIQNPVEGCWRAVVTGTNIPQAPQTYSLILPYCHLNHKCAFSNSGDNLYNSATISINCNLQQDSKVKLKFKTSYNIVGSDSGSIHLKIDNGPTHIWATYQGTQYCINLETYEYAIPAGQYNFEITFVYSTGTNSNSDGWNIDDITLETDSGGVLYIENFGSYNIGDSWGDWTIVGTIVGMVEPTNDLYIFGQKIILPLSMPVMIGGIVASAMPTDPCCCDIKEVRFYVDGILKGTDTTAPYGWNSGPDFCQWCFKQKIIRVEVITENCCMVAEEKTVCCWLC